ncbi:MAG: PilZ domain-containing protein [Desulfobacter sp.]|nr:MAG: PilZ domain-containing protein [Desulfobacter sp.]
MDSTQNGRERRKLPRAVFSAEENLTAVASLADDDGRQKKFKVMNISRGGLGLAINRDAIYGIAAGGKLILDQITIGIAGKIAPCALPLEVAWVMDHEFLENVGMGCKFIDTRQGAIDDLVAFINQIFPGRIK